MLMVKRMDAYFTSENDATSAEASLQRFQITNMFVDTLPEADETQVFLPIHALGSASAGMGTTGTGGPGIGAYGWIGEDESVETEGDPENHDGMTHMLEIELADDTDVKAIMEVLKENNAYMLKR